MTQRRGWAKAGEFPSSEKPAGADRHLPPRLRSRVSAPRAVVAAAAALASSPQQPAPVCRRERRLSTSIKSDVGLVVADRQKARHKSLPAVHVQASAELARRSALRKIETVFKSPEEEQGLVSSESRATSAQSRRRLCGENIIELPRLTSEPSAVNGQQPVSNDNECMELTSCHSSESLDKPPLDEPLQTTEVAPPLPSPADMAEDDNGADEVSIGTAAASAAVLRAPVRTTSRTKEELDAEFDRLFASMRQPLASRETTPRLSPVDRPISVPTAYRGRHSARRQSYADTILKQEFNRNTLHAATAAAAAHEEKEKERRDILGERIDTSAFHGLEVVQAKVEALVQSASNMGSASQRAGKPRLTM